MPSGRKDIYGAPSRRLADPKVIKAEMGAQRNAAAAARLAGRKLDADKLLAREGTTNPSGGRPNTPATPNPAPKAAPKAAPAKASRGSGMGTMSDRDLQIVKGAAAAARARATAPRGSGMGTMSNRDLQIVKSAAAKSKPTPAAKPSQVIRTTQLYKPTPTKKK